MRGINFLSFRKMTNKIISHSVELLPKVVLLVFSVFVRSLMEGQDLARYVNSSVKACVHSG